MFPWVASVIRSGMTLSARPQASLWGVTPPGKNGARCFHGAFELLPVLNGRAVLRQADGTNIGGVALNQVVLLQRFDFVI
jgi:hypothetical protein